MPVITAIAGRGSPRLVNSSPVPFSSRQNMPPPENRGGGAAATAFQHRHELRVDGARATVEELQRGHCLIGRPVVDDRPWKLSATITAGQVARPPLATLPRRHGGDPSRPELTL